MKLTDWLPNSKDLEALQGLERELLERRRNGQRVSWLLATASLLPILLGQDYSRLTGFIETMSAGYRPWLALGLLLAACAAYAITRYTALLLRHTDEVFRYSFSVQTFKWVAGTPGDRVKLDAHDRVELLALDLTGMLAKRVRRMDLLQAAPGAPGGGQMAAPTRSHITVSGDVVLREQPNDGWVLQATPRLRVGDINAPEILSYPVKFRLGPMDPADKFVPFSPAQYQQFCERIYASTALAVYQCIRKDLHAKLALFPTRYRRVKALLNEAEDLAQSNTVDATHSAVGLYKQAQKDFNACWQWGLARLFRTAHLPTAWYRDAYLTRTRLLTGKTNCEVTNAIASALVGKTPQGTYGLRRPLRQAVNDLGELLKRQNSNFVPWGGRWTLAERKHQKRQASMDTLKSMLFDARVALALAHLRESETRSAQEQLEAAEKLHPGRVLVSRELMLLRADMTPEPPLRVSLLRNLMEHHPDFQIGQFMLAAWSEMLLRSRGELEPLRAEPVVREYERVLEINPGNVGALASLGYLHWLLGQHAAARTRYEEGLNLLDAAHLRDTYVGELRYGLARVAAEQACQAKDTRRKHALMIEALEHYTLAVDRDPALAVGSGKTDRSSGTGPFEYIVPAMRARYMRYWSKANKHIALLQATPAAPAAGLPAERVRNLHRLLAFLANDVANAQLQTHIRLCAQRSVQLSCALVDQACKLAPDTAAFHVNRYVHRSWRGPQVPEALDAAKKLAPEWSLVDDFQVDRLCERIIEQARKERDKRRDQQAGKAPTMAAPRLPSATPVVVGASDAAPPRSPIDLQTNRPGSAEAPRDAGAMPSTSELAEIIMAPPTLDDDYDVLKTDLDALCSFVASIYKRLPLRTLQSISVLPGQAGASRSLAESLETIDTDELNSDHFRSLIRAQKALMALHKATDLKVKKQQLKDEISCVARWFKAELSQEDFEVLTLCKDVGGDCFDDRARQDWENLYLRELRTDPMHCNALAWIKSIDLKQFKIAIEALANAAYYVPNSARRHANTELQTLLAPAPTADKVTHAYEGVGAVAWPLPLALDLSPDLVAMVVDEQSQLTDDADRALRTLRKHIRSRAGIELPGLRLRPNDGLEPATAFLSVHGVATALIRADQPVANATLQLPNLPQPVNSLLHHVQDSLIGELSIFCGPDEVDALWREAIAARQRADRPSQRLSDEHLVRLTSLMSVLLDQRLPVHDVVALGELVREDMASDLPDFDALVAAARNLPRIRQRLQDDTQAAPLWQVHATAQSVLSGQLHGRGDQRCLALPPELTQALLQAVRSEWQDTPVPVLLVTDRRLVNGLTAVLRMEWPRCVVARPQELPPQRMFELRGMIDWTAR